MNKFVLHLISVCLFLACSTPETKPVLYFLGDSHLARLDVDWWMPEYTSHNLSVSGSKIQDVYAQLPEATEPFSLAILEIGVNNTPFIRNEEHMRIQLNILLMQYDSLLTHMQQSFMNTLVLSVIPVSEKFAAPSSLLSEYFWQLNQNLELLVRNYSNITYLDISSIITNEAYYLREDVTTDGLHLNEYGYVLITARIKNHLNEATW